jgi:hypothetical protein
VLAAVLAQAEGAALDARKCQAHFLQRVRRILRFARRSSRTSPS